MWCVKFTFETILTEISQNVRFTHFPLFSNFCPNVSPWNVTCAVARWNFPFGNSVFIDFPQLQVLCKNWDIAVLKCESRKWYTCVRKVDSPFKHGLYTIDKVWNSAFPDTISFRELGHWILILVSRYYSSSWYIVRDLYFSPNRPKFSAPWSLIVCSQCSDASNLEFKFAFSDHKQFSTILWVRMQSETSFWIAEQSLIVCTQRSDASNQTLNPKFF